MKKIFLVEDDLSLINGLSFVMNFLIPAKLQADSYMTVGFLWYSCVIKRERGVNHGSFNEKLEFPTEFTTIYSNTCQNRISHDMG